MIITLCGSKKFANEIYALQKKLKDLGNTVYAPMFNSVLSMDYLIQIHKYKILASELIIICNCNNYIGLHTQEEINFATENGKQILYTNQRL